jgi:hypothetical protein
MKNIRPALCIWIALLATGAFASQYPTSPSQATTQPTQVPQTQGSTQPGQSAPGSAQPGQSQSAPSGQQGQQQMSRPSIDDQVKMLTQELNLTPEQQTKMKTVLEDQHQQAMTIINDSSLPRDQKIQKIRSLRETTISKARSMLNDDQKKKLDAMLEQSDRMHQQQGQSSSPSSAQPGTTSPGSNQPSTNTPGSTTAPGSTPPPTNRPPR